MARDPYYSLAQAVAIRDAAEDVITQCALDAAKQGMARERWEAYRVLHDIACPARGLDPAATPHQHNTDVCDGCDAIYTMGRDDAATLGTTPPRSGWDDSVLSDPERAARWRHETHDEPEMCGPECVPFLAATPAPLDVHPGENHEYNMTCRRCGEPGYLFVGFHSPGETFRWSGRLQPKEADHE
jgi:hypothetical protein